MDGMFTAYDMTLSRVVTRERSGGLEFALRHGEPAGTRICFRVQVTRAGIILQTIPARGAICVTVPSPGEYWTV